MIPRIRVDPSHWDYEWHDDDAVNNLRYATYIVYVDTSAQALQSLQCSIAPVATRLSPAMQSDSETESHEGTAVPRKSAAAVPSRGDHPATSPHKPPAETVAATPPSKRGNNATTEMASPGAASSSMRASPQTCSVVAKVPANLRPAASGSREIVALRPFQPPLQHGMPPDAAFSPRGVRCGICHQGPPKVNMAEEEEDACEDCYATSQECFPRLTFRKLNVLCSGNEELRQDVLATTLVRKGEKSKPGMPERVGVNVRSGTITEKWYWHLTPSEFVEEFKKKAEVLHLCVDHDCEDEQGNKLPGYLIDLGCGVASAEILKVMLGEAATLTHGRLIRRFHCRNSFLDLETMPTAKHCRAGQGVEELQQARDASTSMGPDFVSQAITLDGFRKRLRGQAVEEPAPKKSRLTAFATQVLKATATWMLGSEDSSSRAPAAPAAAPPRGPPKGPSRRPAAGPPRGTKRGLGQGVGIVFDPDDQRAPPQKSRKAAASNSTDLSLNLAKLPLEEIVVDQIHKVGNVIRGVEKIKNGWSAFPEKRDDVKSLKAHLIMATAAAEVSLELLSSATWEECEINLDSVSQKKDVNWPWKWMIAVTRKRANNSRMPLEMISIMWPFREDSTNARRWAPNAARLCDTQGLDDDAADPTQRDAVDTFQSHMLTRLIVILEDEDAQPLMSPEKIDWKKVAGFRTALWQRWAMASEGEQKQVVLTCEIFDAVLFLLACTNCGAECPDEAAAPHDVEVSYHSARKAWSGAKSVGAAGSAQSALHSLGEIMAQSFWNTEQKALAATMVPTARLAPILAEHTQRLLSKTASMAELAACADMLPGWRQQMRPRATLELEKAFVKFIAHLRPQVGAASDVESTLRSEEELDTMSNILTMVGSLSLPGLDTKTVTDFQEAIDEVAGRLQEQKDIDTIEEEARKIAHNVFDNLSSSLEKLKKISTAASAQGQPESIEVALASLQRSAALMPGPEEGGHWKLLQVAELGQIFASYSSMNDGGKVWEMATSIGEALEATAGKVHPSEKDLKAFKTAFQKIPKDWAAKLESDVAEELKTYLTSCMDVCEGILGDSMSKRETQKKTALEVACAKLGEWAGGAANGESWKHGISDVVGPKTFKALQDAYATHMGALDQAEWLRRKKTLEKALKAYQTACGKSGQNEDAKLVENTNNTLNLSKLTLAEGLLMECLAEEGEGIAEAMETMVKDNVNETDVHPEIWRRAQAALR